jgi:hypothetical protein
MSDPGVIEILRAIQADVADVKGALVPMRAQLDGLPIINRGVIAIQQDMRALRGAFNRRVITN